MEVNTCEMWDIKCHDPLDLWNDFSKISLYTLHNFVVLNILQFVRDFISVDIYLSYKVCDYSYIEIISFQIVCQSYKAEIK